jgi:23S rRNA (cytosine1962-C5)-methyltransferase
MQPVVFEQPPFPDYALLDSGGAEKLERFGHVVLRRPDPQALWTKRVSEADWARADLTFVRETDRGGRWEARAGAHKSAMGDAPQWNVRFGSAQFVIRPTPFKHVGLFPEQAANWERVTDAFPLFGVERPRLLNLFGYTGAASVLAAQRGYEVTHVDASKASVAWTRENAEVSGLPDDAMRLVLDDALGYARREARRGSKYNVVLLDPPHYGRGPKGETWQFEDGIAPLMATVRDLLAPRALVILSTYAIGCSPLTFHNLMQELGEGEIEAGELALPAREGGLELPCGFCARFLRGSA